MKNQKDLKEEEAKKSIDDLVDEFKAQTEQEQRSNLFLLLMSLKEDLGKGFNQIGHNQQEIVNYMTQRGIRPMPKKKGKIVGLDGGAPPSREIIKK